MGEESIQYVNHFKDEGRRDWTNDYGCEVVHIFVEFLKAFLLGQK